MITEVDANKYAKVGKRNSSTQCPVALALMDAIKTRRSDLEAVSVLGDKATLYWKDGTTTETQIEAGVTEAIRKFDETGKAEFPRMWIGNKMDAAFDEFLAGQKRQWGGYRRKEEA